MAHRSSLTSPLSPPPPPSSFPLVFPLLRPHSSPLYVAQIMSHPLSCTKAVGASGAASIRPSLTRSAKKGPEAIRRTALSAAQEQKLILCTSLLKE
eukprot:scaffold74266_cov18-Tisochrysis_lutea.AAC.1